MKLKKFKELINKLPEELDDAIMICQRDAEGNGYSPLAGIDANTIYIPDSTWSGEIYSLEFPAEEHCFEEEEWERLKNDKSKRSIVLFPIS